MARLSKAEIEKRNDVVLQKIEEGIPLSEISKQLKINYDTVKEIAWNAPNEVLTSIGEFEEAFGRRAERILGKSQDKLEIAIDMQQVTVKELIEIHKMYLWYNLELTKLESKLNNE